MFSSATVLLPVHFIVASAQIGATETAASVTAASPAQVESELAAGLELKDSATSDLTILSPIPVPRAAESAPAPTAMVIGDAQNAATAIPGTASAGHTPNVIAGSSATAPVSVPSFPMVDVDVWERVRAGYSLPAYDSKLVRQYERFFTKNPRYLARAVNRGAPYLPYIVKQLEYRGMPTELALLPLVESAYNPFAVSKAKAVGMWQFISSTGARYGLRQDRWFDGRRDIIDSTQAALNYLEFLHQHLDGDWLVAIADYNGC